MRSSVRKSNNNITKVLDNNKEVYGMIVLVSRILQKFQSKRAISDIIVTLLLVAITVIVGIIMFGIVKDTDIAESVTSEVSEPLTFEGGIKINAYDARDGSDLMRITSVDNTFDSELIAGEYIVLNITNNSPNSIFLNDIIVNEISHTLDTDATVPPSPGGTYTIITSKTAGTTQSSSEIQGGRTVTLVVKLGSISDISLNDAIRVKIDATGFDLQNFIITAGHAR